MSKLNRIAICSGLTAALGLGGCATNLRQADADAGVYCYRSPKFHHKTCTTNLPPPPGVEADAKQFEALPAVGTLYVIRNRGWDTVFQVPVSIDGREPVVTIPQSMFRVRLTPGPHQLRLVFDGAQVDQDISMDRGGIRYVEIKEAGRFSGAQFEWSELNASAAITRAKSSKLIADLDLR